MKHNESARSAARDVDDGWHRLRRMEMGTMPRRDMWIKMITHMKCQENTTLMIRVRTEHEAIKTFLRTPIC